MWDRGVNEPVVPAVLQKLLTIGKESYLIKLIYKYLIEMIRKPLTRAKEKSEVSLGREVTETEWVNVLAYTQKISRNTG